MSTTIFTVGDFIGLPDREDRGFFLGDSMILFPIGKIKKEARRACLNPIDTLLR